jgi:hypothetical protein
VGENYQSWWKIGAEDRSKKKSIMSWKMRNKININWQVTVAEYNKRWRCIESRYKQYCFGEGKVELKKKGKEMRSTKPGEKIYYNYTFIFLPRLSLSHVGTPDKKKAKEKIIIKQKHTTTKRIRIISPFAVLEKSEGKNHNKAHDDENE